MLGMTAVAGTFVCIKQQWSALPCLINSVTSLLIPLRTQELPVQTSWELVFSDRFFGARLSLCVEQSALRRLAHTHMASKHYRYSSRNASHLLTSVRSSEMTTRRVNERTDIPTHVIIKSESAYSLQCVLLRVIIMTQVVFFTQKMM